MVLLLLAAVALAEVPEDERWLSSDRLAAGVAVDGSLVNRALDLGLVWDPDGPEGTTPVGGDLIDQGWAVEAWMAEFTAGGAAQRWINNAAHFGSDLTLSWTLPGDGPDALALAGSGSSGALAVDTLISLATDGDVLWFTLRFTALDDVTDLRVGRLLDLDPDATIDGGYASVNSSGEGWAAAAGAWDGRALAMAASGAQGAVCAWCSDLDSLLEGAGASSVGDEQIGLVVELGDLAAGSSAEVTFAYALAMSEDAAIARAEEAALLHDADGDGAPDDEDCDPGDAASAPGASQSWDGEDNDCDGEIDEDTVASDEDADGYTELDGDCDDTNVFVFPGAEPTDGVADANCDGANDDPAWGDGLSEGDLKVEPVGCGCAGAPASSGALGALIASLLLAMRRADPLARARRRG